jgi:hypothetical protein
MTVHVNPRVQAVVLFLSNGSTRIVRAWGMTQVPDGLTITRVELMPPYPDGSPDEVA